MTTLTKLLEKEANLTWAIDRLIQVKFSDNKTFANAQKEVTKARKELEQARKNWIGSLGE